MNKLMLLVCPLALKKEGRKALVMETEKPTITPTTSTTTRHHITHPIYKKERKKKKMLQGVFPEAASLSSGIELKFSYIPPSLDPTNRSAIYRIYWVWLLLLLLLT
ncbi:hypothetical protein Hanom_Chr09g00871691 [Helianthus anomalus]